MYYNTAATAVDNLQGCKLQPGNLAKTMAIKVLHFSMHDKGCDCWC
jgi:hypothetical protein